MADSALIEMVAQNEGYRPTIYKDTKGKRTVGYGFNVDDPVTRAYVPKTVFAGLPLSQEVARAILAKRLELAAKDAQNFVGAETFARLTPARQNVLIDMAYQMGSDGLGGFDKTRKALISGDYGTASDEILRSKYAREDSPNRAYRNAYSMLVAQGYDPQTVQAFQRLNGLDPNGRLDSKSYTLLRKKVSKR